MPSPRCGAARPTASSSSAFAPISRPCCGVVMFRSARPATTQSSTSSPRELAPCWCRSAPNARPSSWFAPSISRGSARPSCCAKATSRRPILPRRSSAPPRAIRCRSRSIPAARRARRRRSPGLSENDPAPRLFCPGNRRYDAAMTYLPRVAAATEAEWPDLAVELDRWEEAGRIARLWWRDDDAVAPSPQLDRLLQIAGGAPLALAVIPQMAEPDLAVRLAGEPHIAVLQHGWRHANHAATGKKSAYPAERSGADIAAELAAGRARLAALFGERALPILVPPWNRFDERFVPLLAATGIAALSQMAPRKTASPTGIAAIDVHLDVVAWHETRGFIGVGAALGRLIAE